MRPTNLLNETTAKRGVKLASMKMYLLSLSILMVTNVCKAQSQPGRSSDEIPILAWYSIPVEETSEARYRELKESGITYSFTSFPDIPSMERALKIAQVAGVKLLVSCPELKTDPAGTVKKFMRHPAVGGYFLRDEPAQSDFAALGEWARQVRAVDDNHFCYINLFPNYAEDDQLGVKSYRGYVHRFIQDVPVQKLSFDNYSVKETTLEKKWYENLEVFADESQKAGKPFWAFALAVTFTSHHVPTAAELRLQVFSNLAYGAQGIQYFTYWTPAGDPIDFHNAPIALDGKRTEVYDRIQMMNKEIKHLSWVFSGAKLVSVGHTGDNIPQGTTRLAKLPEAIPVLETTGEGAVVSVLKNGTDSFLVVVNRDFIKPMKLTLAAAAMVKKVLKDGSTVPAATYATTMQLDPGDAAIYCWPSKTISAK